MKNRWTARLLVLMILAAALNGTVSAAAEAGSASDPLVTLSYLNDTYLTAILGKVDAKIAQRNTDLTAKIDQKIAAATGAGVTAPSGGTAVTFTLVTLTKGQTLTGAVGCEALLRVGTAVCVAASTPGLVDETDGTTLAGGKSLAQNHLYMMTVDDRGVKATAATVKLLVRGTYTVA